MQPGPDGRKTRVEEGERGQGEGREEGKKDEETS